MNKILSLFKRVANFTYVGLMCFCIASCAQAVKKGQPVAANFDENKIILIGKVSRIFAIDDLDFKNETDNYSMSNVEKLLFEITDNKNQPIDLISQWNTLFYFSMDKSNKFILNGLDRLDDKITPQSASPLMLFNPMQIQLTKEDQAVYIGDLHVYTNEFDDIVAIEVIDNSEFVRNIFSLQFGASIKFRTSLLQPMS